MALSFSVLQGKDDIELIEIHDKNTGSMNGHSNRETSEMIRNELFRRELRNYSQNMIDGNAQMNTLTKWITSMTLIILLSTIIQVLIGIGIIL